MKIEQIPYGKLSDGTSVDLMTLTNSRGARIRLTNYGATLVAIEVPDRKGNVANINLGFDQFDPYLLRHPYFGSTVGRFCNRIAHGKFSMDGTSYTLAVNNGNCHLHGGIVGFDRKRWEGKEYSESDSQGIRFRLLSPDGDEGYPGDLEVFADYLWNDDSVLTVNFRATTSRPTTLNLTNHAYFNLGGCKSGKIYDHELRLFCSHYLAVNKDMIPTGERVDVSGTPMDFRNPRRIGERIDALPETNGYDHCFVVDGEHGVLRPCAEVIEPHSGRKLSISTTQPGVQLYTGNFLAGSEETGGFTQHDAFCLETQNFPDAPNQPTFPNSILRPGESYFHSTRFAFGVDP